MLTEVLRHQRKYNVDSSIYKLLQIQFACDSNRIEGNKLTREQTETIFTRNVISGNGIKIDDIIDIKNHFEAFDYLLDNINAQPTHELFHKLHFLLKKNTTDAQNSAFVVGAYKKNEIPPFIISESLGRFYLQGLRNWNIDKTFLIETCHEAQERFETHYGRLTHSFFECMQKSE